MKLPLPVSAFAAGTLVLAGLGVAGAAIVTDGPTPLPRAAVASSGSDDSSTSSTSTSPTAVPAATLGDGVDISGPCDEAEHADDPRCTGTPIAGAPASDDGDVATGGGTAAPAPSGTVRSFAAGDAGTVSYTVDGSGFHLVAASPSAGWMVEIEQRAGDELDLDFRRGTVRVQVDVEFEDGQIRERVRVRDDATDDRTESEVFVGSPTSAPAPSATDDHGGDVDRDDRVEVGDDRDDDDRDDDDRDDDDDHDDDDHDDHDDDGDDGDDDHDDDD